MPNVFKKGPLTRRECQVMWLVAEGLSNKVIADRLDLSEHTVKFHVLHAIFKLEANTRTRAAVRFIVERSNALPPSFVAAIRAIAPAPASCDGRVCA